MSGIHSFDYRYNFGSLDYSYARNEASVFLVFDSVCHIRDYRTGRINMESGEKITEVYSNLQ